MTTPHTTNDNDNTITPESLGLSIVTIDGPAGGVDEGDQDWPHIAYTVEIRRNDKPIWRGPYKLGVGHVNPTKGTPAAGHKLLGVEILLNQWGGNPRAQFTDKHLWACGAAILAKRQRVFPKLADVLSSLLLDGEAYFDACTFEDWAANFGYDSDSRRAEAIFRACDATGRALSRHFTADELTALRQWAANQ